MRYSTPVFNTLTRVTAFIFINKKWKSWRAKGCKKITFFPLNGTLYFLFHLCTCTYLHVEHSSMRIDGRLYYFEEVFSFSTSHFQYYSSVAEAHRDKYLWQWFTIRHFYKWFPFSWHFCQNPAFGNRGLTKNVGIGELLRFYIIFGQ